MNYLEATATDADLTVVMTTQSGIITVRHGLLAPFYLTSPHPILRLVVNGIDCSDHVYQQTEINSDLPFWLWLHQVTGQGWLFR
jgi:hypothetical protein